MTVTDLSCYSMNISPRYVEDWGAFEAGRELVTNARDADPTGCIVEHPDHDMLDVYTRTCPSLENILCLGSGTKDKEDDCIGQFGEGLKLAALVACRTDGAKLVVKGTFGTITYSLIVPEGFTSEILHAHVVPDKDVREGCLITLNYPSIESAMKNRFLPVGVKAGRMDKRDPDNLTIFSKGIFVSATEEKALWDWNVTNCKINRDRNVVDMHSVKCNVGYMLGHEDPETSLQLDIGLARDMFKKTCFESACVELTGLYSIHAEAIKVWKTAFIAQYGNDAVLLSDLPMDNELAEEAGKNPVSINSQLKDVLKTFLPNAADFKPQPEKLKALPMTDEQVKQVKEVVALMDLLEVAASVNLFDPTKCVNVKSNEMEACAQCERTANGLRMWLSVELFEPGRRTERLGIVVSQLAHLNTGMAEAGTRGYEKELTRLSGRVAGAWCTTTSKTT